MDLDKPKARMINLLESRIADRRVIDVMARVPRELFVPLKIRRLAYDDSPLPIGQGQTISQPLIVAMMTEALELTGSERVLEVGTGSGYQTAILAELSHHVVTVERQPMLLENARKVLKELGYTNIEIHPAATTLGWPAGALYDAIIVTAGAPSIPEGLVSQLAVGGHMVIPVGSRSVQDLCKITKHAGGNTVENLGGCHFVSLIGESAWKD